MKILYFGTFDPEYSRNRVLIKGLKKNGAEILFCNDRSGGLLKYIKLFFKYLKYINKFDFMIVGFPGQEVMLLARLLTKKPIIFDAFTSHFGGHILDRGKYDQDSIHAKWYRWIDKKSVENSSITLLDTNAHIDFFVNEFNLPRSKFIRVFVGTDTDIFYPRENKINDKFLVHFHGNYIPLQGVKYIIEAAKLLEKDNIRFNIIGQGQTYEGDRELAEKLEIKNINFIGRVPYEKLADWISNSDLCLGIFGETQKADIVIPNKIFEYIASGKPVITRSSSAINELFIDGENILLCEKANPEDLAKKILEVKNNPALAQLVARNGYETFKNNCAEFILGRQLLSKINGIL